MVYMVPMATWNPWKAWNLFWLLEPWKLPGSLCKNLESPWNLRKTQKIDQHISFFLPKFHTVLSSTVFFRKIIDTSIECCIGQQHSWNKWEKLLEIFMYNKVTTVFQNSPWKFAVDPLITFEFPHLRCVRTQDVILNGIYLSLHKVELVKHICSRKCDVMYIHTKKQKKNV